MARTNNLSDFLHDVANAIRNKKGTSDSIPAEQFDIEIESIESGSTGVDTTDATATELDIAEGQTAYVKGQKIQGIVPTIAENEFYRNAFGK